jgi:hypothetical protein
MSISIEDVESLSLETIQRHARHNSWRDITGVVDPNVEFYRFAGVELVQHD